MTAEPYLQLGGGAYGQKLNAIKIDGLPSRIFWLLFLTVSRGAHVVHVYLCPLMLHRCVVKLCFQKPKKVNNKKRFLKELNFIELLV